MLFASSRSFAATPGVPFAMRLSTTPIGQSGHSPQAPESKRKRMDERVSRRLHEGNGDEPQADVASIVEENSPRSQVRASARRSFCDQPIRRLGALDRQPSTPQGWIEQVDTR